MLAQVFDFFCKQKMHSLMRNSFIIQLELTQDLLQDLSATLDTSSSEEESSDEDGEKKQQGADKDDQGEQAKLQEYASRFQVSACQTNLCVIRVIRQPKIWWPSEPKGDLKPGDSAGSVEIFLRERLCLPWVLLGALSGFSFFFIHVYFSAIMTCSHGFLSDHNFLHFSLETAESAGLSGQSGLHVLPGISNSSGPRAPAVSWEIGPGVVREPGADLGGWEEAAHPERERAEEESRARESAEVGH